MHARNRNTNTNTTVTEGTRMLVYNQSGINWLNENDQLRLYTTDLMLKKYYQYFEDHTVTLRERNSATQIRVEANSIPTILESLRNGSSTFSDLG